MIYPHVMRPRRAVEVRDGECFHPYCDRPAPSARWTTSFPTPRGAPPPATTAAWPASSTTAGGTEGPSLRRPCAGGGSDRKLDRMRVRFEGEICGFGTEAGHRVVIGRWSRSPFGPVADVMVQTAGGQRVLLAPRQDLARFVAGTYRFDEVRITSVAAGRDDSRLVVTAGELHVVVSIGRRTMLGRALRVLPRRITASPMFATVADPVARMLLPDVRTKGSAGNRRREWYGAHDVHAVVAVEGTWGGEPLGGVAPLDPAVTFGFGSAPRAPSLVAVTTTIASD